MVKSAAPKSSFSSSCKWTASGLCIIVFIFFFTSSLMSINQPTQIKCTYCIKILCDLTDTSILTWWWMKVCLSLFTLVLRTFRILYPNAILLCFHSSMVLYALFDSQLLSPPFNLNLVTVRRLKKRNELLWHFKHGSISTKHMSL